MIEQVFLRPSVRRRMAGSHLGIILERFALDLHARGYVKTCLQSYVQITEHFSRWLGRRGLASGDVDEQVVERFIRGHLPRCRCRVLAATHRGACQAALRCFLRFLREQHLASPPAPPTPSGADHLVGDYDRYLSEVGGLAESTRYYRRRYAREFLKAVARSLHQGRLASISTVLGKANSGG